MISDPQCFGGKLESLRQDQIPSGFNPNLLHLVHAGRAAGLPDEKIREAITENMPPRCEGREGEIDRALRRAYTNKNPRLANDVQESVPLIDSKPEALPSPVKHEPWSKFLLTLFKVEDSVTICPGCWSDDPTPRSEPDNDKRETRTVREWIGIFDANGGPSGYWSQGSDSAGAFVIVNPTKGAKIEDTIRFQNILVEFDGGSKEGQLGAIKASGFEPATLVDSGNKSLHAVFRTRDAQDANSYKVVTKRLYGFMRRYKIDGRPPELDKGNCSANRYTRLPGAQRLDRMQELLNYEEDPVPIEECFQDATDRIYLAGLPPPVSAGEYLSRTPPQHNAILVDLMDRKDKVAIIGSSKSRKTFFTIQLAVCLGAGKPFLSWQMCKPQRVLYVNLELKADTVHRRIHKIGAMMGIAIGDLSDRLQIISLRGHEVHPEHLLALARHHKADVLICDPLYKLDQTGDELAESLKPVMRAFDRITNECGATVVYVHHNPKGCAGDRKTIDRGSGSGVLARDYDLGLYIDDHAQGGELRVLTAISRDYPPSEPVSITWDDGLFKTTTDFPVVETSASRKSRKPEVSTEQVLMHLQERGVMVKSEFDAMVRTLTRSREDQRTLCDKLIADRHIQIYQEPRKGGPKWCGTEQQIRQKKAELRESSQTKINYGGEK